MATTNMKSARPTSGLREKAKEDLRLFSAIAIYLALMLEALFSYRSLTLLESGITAIHYGVAVIEALILAKMILIGQALRLGKGIEGEPLIVSVLVKTLLFGAFVAVFSVIEDVILGWVHHETWDVIAHHVFAGGRDEILARTLVIIVAFIPFFAFSEVDRALGQGKLFALFFRKRTP